MVNSPLCFGCKQMCVIRVSKARNQNYGRRFWACQSALRGGTCVRWNGWLDPPKKILKCSECRKTPVLIDDEKYIGNISGLLLIDKEQTALISKELGLLVCKKCKSKEKDS